MILTAQCDGEIYNATIDGALPLLDRLVDWEGSGGESIVENGVLEMFLTLTEWRPKAGWFPDHILRTGLNAQTGYGALVWMPLGDRVDVGHASNSGIWVSDAGERIATAAKVPTGYQENAYHPVENLVPLRQVRFVLENFCRSSSGDRPSGISWARGGMDGQRLT